MKYIKPFNEQHRGYLIPYDEIQRICNDYNIRNYTINDDGSIDVDGPVSLSSCGLTKLPLRFRNVTGYFYCSYNQLTTLEGAPTSVGYNFDCSYNQLTSLEGSPEYVGANFFCNDNQLTNLEGAPKSVNAYFNCSYNKITSLEGAPTSVGSFSCQGNPIHKWWDQINDLDKLETFIDLGIDSNNPDWINQEKIDYIK